jgi:Tfp pilus assembly protein PilN
MRAVNLLPEKHRPRRPSGGKSGSSYALLGVLALVVGAVLTYVVTLNSINSAKTDIAEAEAATAAANAQADQLGAYGDFAKVKEQRVAAVKLLADGRMDWERVVRELAHVLPEGVWIQNAAASEVPTEAGEPASGSDEGTVVGGPTLTLTGCAPDQAVVADTLVRLRQLQGAVDVKLDHSTKPEESSSSSASGDSAASAGNCGASDGRPNYEFQAAVTLEAPMSDPGPGNVPARLGGGE